MSWKMPGGTAWNGVPLDLPASTLDDQIELMMRDGQWRTCTEISLALQVQDPWQVKLRLRQEKIKGHTIHRRQRDGDGFWEYQLEGRAK